MSTISRLTGTAEDARRVQEAVRKHPLPDYVTGFDVEFGEFDGDPALWIFFKLKGKAFPHTARVEDAKLQADEMNTLVAAMRSDVLGVVPDRLPYFRFVSDSVESTR